MVSGTFSVRTAGKQGVPKAYIKVQVLEGHDVALLRHREDGNNMDVELMLHARRERKMGRSSWQKWQAMKETLDMHKRCSWVDGHGHRVQGTFVQWQGDFAVTKQLSGFKCRVHKSNLTFEIG